MTPSRRAVLAGLVAVTLIAAAGPRLAAQEGREPAGSGSVPPVAVSPATEHFHAAQQIAEVITLATGIPVSPLVGVSGLGAYRWWSTPVERRGALPWYARPPYWGTGLFLAFLFAVNTTVGALVPGLKKPMDFVEHYENQVSAIVASPIVLVEAYRIVAGLPAIASLGAGLAPGAAAITGGGAALGLLARIGTGALVLLAFAVVFLAFHSIQVLIALSPSALLDLGLRAFRLSTLGLVAMAASVHPYVGAAFGLLLLFAATLVVGWSFRLAVFGWVVGGDIVTRRRVADPRTAPLVAFASAGLAGPPVRSLGRVEPQADGAAAFAWRPWLVLPRRRSVLPTPFALRRGTLSPQLISLGGVREPALVRFAPRFRGLEEALAERLAAAEVLDARWVRGLKAAWRWLRAMVQGEGRDAPV